MNGAGRKAAPLPGNSSQQTMPMIFPAGGFIQAKNTASITQNRKKGNAKKQRAASWDQFRKQRATPDFREGESQSQEGSKLWPNDSTAELFQKYSAE